MIPMALVGLLALVALGAAIIGLLGSPSSAQISLQSAAMRTAEAANFDYTVGSQIDPVEANAPTTSVPFHGVWRAPDQWLVTNTGDGATSMTTVEGSTLRVSYGRHPALTFRFSTPGITESMTDPDSPVLSVPPLGLLFAATDIKRTGDEYSFVIPRLNIGISGWVAYAPLSRATTPLLLTDAVNTRANAVIKNGYVASLVFPHGIRPLRGAALHFAGWHISNIGNARFNDPARPK